MFAPATLLGQGPSLRCLSNIAGAGPQPTMPQQHCLGMAPAYDVPATLLGQGPSLRCLSNIAGAGPQPTMPQQHCWGRAPAYDASATCWGRAPAYDAPAFEWATYYTDSNKSCRSLLLGNF